MSIKKLQYIFLTLLLVMISCKKKDDTVPQPIDTSNLWYAPSKGYVLDLTGDTTKLYSVSTAGPTLMDDNVLPENYLNIEFAENGDQLIGTSDLFIDKVYFNKVSKTNPIVDTNAIEQTNDPKINFQYFWDIFNDYYAFFELRDVNWQDNLALLPKVTSDNLFDTFGKMIAPLNDLHVSVINEEGAISSGEERLLDSINSNLSSDYTIENFTELISLAETRLSLINSTYLNNQFNSDDNGNMIWGLLNNEIGYFNVRNMGGYASIDQERTTVNNLMNEVMNDIQQTNINKLIIDLRFNGGGFDGIALEIASRFVTTTNTVFTIKSKNKTGITDEQTITLSPKGNVQFSGEIVLLTSPFTASAAEIFVLCLKDLPNITIVGQNTNGVFSSVLTHRLPNGAFINLSNQIYTDNSGNVFEGVGIDPNQDNRVPFLSTYDLDNSIDSGIEKSLDILK